MKTLHLTLKKKWFDMIASGEKTEEYREIKPYWIVRFVDINYPEETKGENKVIPHDIRFDIENGHAPDVVLQGYFSQLKQFDGAIFKNGYSGGAPLISFKSVSLSIGEGRADWGAEPGKKYFVIKLGEPLPSPLKQ